MQHARPVIRQTARPRDRGAAPPPADAPQVADDEPATPAQVADALGPPRPEVRRPAGQARAQAAGRRGGMGRGGIDFYKDLVHK